MTQRTGPHTAVGGMLLSPRGRAGSTGMKPKLLPYSYFATQHGLDISLRFSDKNDLADAAGLLQEHVSVSRRHLARIYLDHNVI
ncbi:hypothetical protein GQ54DRAFT_181152 [Martensiomyces pterosporus]|nr:hypothetical protein GQ54DRAFT_181152 [Martensiomyces pterosporus]